MKIRRTLTALILAVSMIVCGSSFAKADMLKEAVPVPEGYGLYPDMEVKGEYNLVPVTVNGIETMIPDTWVLSESDTIQGYLLIQRANPTAGDNISIMVSEYLGRDFEDPDVTDFTESFGEQAATLGYDITTQPMMVLVDGNRAMYYDYDVNATEEMLDLTIETGALPQEIVDLLGREYVMQLLSCHQAGIMRVIDGNIVLVTGTYYDPAVKDEIVDILQLMSLNAKITG